LKSYALLYDSLSTEQKEKLEGWLATTAGDSGGPRDTTPIFEQAMREYLDYALSPEGCGFFRLPTEAEWEYAAEGGQDFRYGTVDGSLRPEVAIYAREQPAIVGTLAPNPYGLYDLAGNVAEFCIDRMSFYTTDPGVNPVGDLFPDPAN